MNLTSLFVLMSLLFLSLNNCINGEDFLSRYNTPLDYTKSSMKEFTIVKDLKKLPHKVTLVLCSETSVYYILKIPSVIHRYAVTFPPSPKEFHFDSVEHEIRLMQAINHPLIVRMPHYFTNEGHPYMVIDYVEGGTLAELINTLGNLEEWHIRFYLGQILSATKHLHDHGVTHGDLFNVNIMLDKHGNVKIIDFERSLIFFGTTRNAARESAGSTTIETKHKFGTMCLEFRKVDVVNSIGSSKKSTGFDELINELTRTVNNHEQCDEVPNFLNLNFFKSDLEMPGIMKIDDSLDTHLYNCSNGNGNNKCTSKGFQGPDDWEMLVNGKVTAPFLPFRTPESIGKLQYKQIDGTIAKGKEHKTNTEKTPTNRKKPNLTLTF